MLRTPPANRRPSLRNRRNQQQPATVANRRDAIVFTPKLKYSNSFFNDNGIFVVTKRKRALPTEAEKETKRQKKLQVQTNRVALTELQWKVVGFYQHGACMENYQFAGGPKSGKTIIRYLQENYPQYRKYNAVKSFFYATIKKFKTRQTTPHLDPFREIVGKTRNHHYAKIPILLPWLTSGSVRRHQNSKPTCRLAVTQCRYLQFTELCRISVTDGRNLGTPMC